MPAIHLATKIVERSTGRARICFQLSFWCSTAATSAATSAAMRDWQQQPHLPSGLVPALSSDDRQVLNVLQGASRSHTGSRDKVRLRRILLTAEVGLTMVLLTSAGLLLKSYQQGGVSECGKENQEKRCKCHC
jgi:hypothetical protein